MMHYTYNKKSSDNYGVIPKSPDFDIILKMKPRELIDTVKKGREGLIVVINEILKGNTDAVDGLNTDVFNGRNRQVFLWNAQLMGDRKRYSGKPYYVHPASAAYIVSSFDIENENKNKANGYALTHDALDEAIDYNTARFSELREKYGEIYRDELDAAVLLCPPELGLFFDKFPFEARIAQKVSTVLQVKSFGDISHAYALMADKLDNQLDLEYLADREETRKKNAIALWFIAYPLFTVGELGDMVPSGLREFVERVSDETRREYGIGDEMVKEYLKEFRAIKERHSKDLNALSERHLIKYGFMRQNP